MENAFLNQIAKELFLHYENNFLNLTVILPNKRAKLFLIEALKTKTNATFFAPNIISIETLFEEITNIRNLDNIDLLFEFYQVYLKLTPNIPQNFETFSPWAKTLLQDFNEIDRYEKNPNEIFNYLLEIERIKNWHAEAKPSTDLVENYLDFWRKMPIYYTELTNHLLTNKIGYQGLIYRNAVSKIKQFALNQKNHNYVFIGFNALSTCEEKIIQHLLEHNNAKIYWDIDANFMNDPIHDAGLFLRKIKKSWKHFNSFPFEWLHNEYADEKNIQIISTPKSVGQAKITGKIIEELLLENSINLNKTAIVLAEENLLLPILNALPNQVKKLNITMGYSSKNSPAQLLVFKILKLHISAQKRNPKENVYYYQDVLAILNNPLLENIISVSQVINEIKRNNLTYFTQNKLERIFKNHYTDSNLLFSIIFSDWKNDIQQIINKIKAILIAIKNNLNAQPEINAIALTFVFSIHETIQKIENYYQKHLQIENLESFFALYKQVVDKAEVAFEGEPLEGLQIMGILESRVLDFENVIITSVNEGKLPAGNTTQSYIPFDVKIEKGLPTFKERDAIFTYHFYRLLQRAKNIYLIYNSVSEGIDAGEKSRFLTQLEIETHKNHKLQLLSYNASLPKANSFPFKIAKQPLILDRLKEIATIKGFSPSAITNYLRNPKQFYLQRILSIRENEEVEEELAVNTLGTIIHGVLEQMYKPFVISKKPVLIDDILVMISNIDIITQTIFKEVYKDGDFTFGKNLISFEVAKRSVFNFLQTEKTNLENGDELFILALEADFETTINHINLPYPVKISGKVDRVELRNNNIRIIDYKTGKVALNDLKIKTFENLTTNIKNEKIIQLLCYALMFQNNENAKKHDLQTGIFSFKNISLGFIPFNFKEEKCEDQTIITNNLLSLFTEELVILIAEILNPDVAFIENI